MRQRHSVIFTILTGRDPGHFFEKFKEIGIAGEAEKFLYLGDGPALCQHRLGEVSPLHGDIMPDGGMGMFLEQAPEIVLVQVEFCSNAFQGQWLVRCRLIKAMTSLMFFWDWEIERCPVEDACRPCWIRLSSILSREKKSA